MSIVRFNVNGSDVYIYESVKGYVSCCMCMLTEHADGTTPDDPRLIGDDLPFHSAESLLTHVAEHRAAGHCVPEYVDNEVRRTFAAKAKREAKVSP